MNSEKMSNLAAVYLLPYTILVFSALPVISYICILHKSIKYSAKFCFKAVKSFKVLIREKKKYVDILFHSYNSCCSWFLPISKLPSGVTSFQPKEFSSAFLKYSSASYNFCFYLKMHLFCLHFWSTVALHIEFLVSIFIFFAFSTSDILFQCFLLPHFLDGKSAITHDRSCWCHFSVAVFMSSLYNWLSVLSGCI